VRGGRKAAHTMSTGSRPFGPRASVALREESLFAPTDSPPESRALLLARTDSPCGEPAGARAAANARPGRLPEQESVRAKQRQSRPVGAWARGESVPQQTRMAAGSADAESPCAKRQAPSAKQRLSRARGEASLNAKDEIYARELNSPTYPVFPLLCGVCHDIDTPPWCFGSPARYGSP
jgi:hypothetical protein